MVKIHFNRLIFTQSISIGLLDLMDLILNVLLLLIPRLKIDLQSGDFLLLF